MADVDGLSAEQAQRVREAAERLLVERRGNRSALARELGLSVPTLADLLDDAECSLRTVQRVAALAGVPWLDLLTGRAA
jgi:AraC-like DNA-binding protein